MLVYVQRNYDFPDLFRQTPANDGVWEGIKFTFDPVEECDYVVVLNHPRKDIHVKCRKGGRILIIQEPPYEGNSYLLSYFKFFDKVISGFDTQKFPKSIHSPAGLPWHIGKNYNELRTLRPDVGTKVDKVSWITSNNNIFPQHKVRLGFIEFLKQKNYAFDLYGRGFHPIVDKFDGIAPYKYTIAAENYLGSNYFTEKIVDAYLSWTMPIYAGSQDIINYFPPESLVQIDLNNPQDAYEKIKWAVEDKLWEKNIEAIAYARELVLNKYQLFPMVTGLIKEMDVINEYEDTFIPFDSLTKYERLKKNIKRLF